MNQLHYNQEKSPKRTPANVARKAFWDAALGDNSKLANLAKAAITEAEQQAKAGELGVFAFRWSWYDDTDGSFHSDIIKAPRGGMQETETHSFITLQSHREAIAKKDTALKACVEALEWADNAHKEGEPIQVAIQAAISQGQEALK